MPVSVFCLYPPPVKPRNFRLFGGGSRAANTNTYTWAFNYQEGLGQYFAASFTWLNEGHIPDHHRDGQMIQFWGRIPVGNPQFVLQAGVGPYRYFDTTTAEQGGSYSDTHGWGVVYSVRAAYYASSRWITQLQLNRVHVQRGPDATSVMFGVGYQLDAPGTPGPRDWASGSTHNVTNNEVAVYLGKTIVNSTSSPTALGGAIEYRRGLAKYLDVTLGYLHEGSSKVARRDGYHQPAVGDARVPQRQGHARARARRLLRDQRKRKQRVAGAGRREVFRPRHDRGLVSLDRSLGRAARMEPRRDSL